AKATISSSYMSNSGDEIEDDESNDSRDENRKNIKYKQSKNRNRTTIFPEQQDYLMSKYPIELHPLQKIKRKDSIKFDSNQLLDDSTINKKCIHSSLTFKLIPIFENDL
ncbi:unnamed protein product, partial [Rotaria sordida]